MTQSAIEVISQADVKVSAWSGGSTAEIAIYPQDAQYAARDFAWRVSVARLDADTSVFTPLPGIERILILLRGHLILDHQGHHRVSLHPFDQDRFDGDWHTTSWGQAEDFNIMLSRGCQATARMMTVDQSQSIPLPKPRTEGTAAWSIVYVAEGSVSVGSRSQPSVSLHCGDTLLAHSHRMTLEPGLIDLASTSPQPARVIAVVLQGAPAP